MNKNFFNIHRFAHIINYTRDTLITGTANDDSITNYGSKVTIDSGAGIVFHFVYASNVTISGGDGNDSILN